MPVAQINNNSNNSSIEPGSGLSSIIIDTSRLCLEAGRLETFTDNWPHKDDTLCSKSRMAKAGFFYNGRYDCVQCFICHIAIDDWEPHCDEPMTKHKECSPTCMFAMLGKEEDQLTVEQWLDCLNSRSINRLNLTLGRIISQ